MSRLSQSEFSIPSRILKYRNFGTHARAIDFSLVCGGGIPGNAFVNSGELRMVAGMGSPQDDSQPMQLKQCQDILVKDNRP